MQIITKSIYITVKCFVKQKINSAVETTIQRNTEEKLWKKTPFFVTIETIDKKWRLRRI